MKNILEVQLLSRSFGEKNALDNVDFTVKAGVVCGFLGPNGSGKTTAMRAILGITSKDSGKVLWNGKPITEKDLESFGYLPEERGLYPTMKVLDQLVYFAQLHGISTKIATKKAYQWLERLGLSDRTNDKIQSLSLGNQQRVQLIAMLIHEPDLLLLDEPFSGLDPVAVGILSTILKEQARRGAVVLFSSHQLDLVETICDDIVIIHKGKVVLSGPLDKLRNSGRYELIVRFHEEHPQWIQSLPVGQYKGKDSEGHIIVIDSTHEVQMLLQYLMKDNTIEAFYPKKKSLNQLFREAISK